MSVKLYRRNLKKKMQANSLADLVRIASVLKIFNTKV
jgi:FixJ family two-component response regulator